MKIIGKYEEKVKIQVWFIFIADSRRTVGLVKKKMIKKLTSIFCPLKRKKNRRLILGKVRKRRELFFFFKWNWREIFHLVQATYQITIDTDAENQSNISMRIFGNEETTKQFSLMINQQDKKISFDLDDVGKVNWERQDFIAVL